MFPKLLGVRVPLYWEEGFGEDFLGFMVQVFHRKEGLNLVSEVEDWVEWLGFLCFKRVVAPQEGVLGSSAVGAKPFPLWYL